MTTTIQINKYPFILWPTRAKEATIEGNKCQTIADGVTVENRLIAVEKEHIYALKYLPMLILGAVMGWGYELRHAIGYMIAAGLLSFYFVFWAGLTEKRQIFSLAGLSVAGAVAALFGYGTEVIFGFQYTIGAWLLLTIYTGVKSQEYMRYRAVEGLPGLYVFIPWRKNQTRKDIALMVAHVLLVIGSGLSAYHGYIAYQEHQKTLEAAAQIKAEANKTKPIITPAAPKRQESRAETEAARLLGLGGGQ